MQIPCCVAQWTIWHFFPHTERALLIIYCPSIVNYGEGIGEKKSKYPSSGVKWSLARSIFLSFFWFFLRWFFFFLHFSNQLSDIPYEARQATGGFGYGFWLWLDAFLLAWVLISASEMLRLISCHKPNDKTYFCRLSKCARAQCYYCCLFVFIYGEARCHTKIQINFKFDYNKNKVHSS